MREDALVKYRYLWDRSSPNWVLLEAPDLPGGYCVFHKTKHTLLHVDDSNLNAAICKRMKASGCEILKHMPPDTEIIASPS